MEYFCQCRYFFFTSRNKSNYLKKKLNLSTQSNKFVNIFNSFFTWKDVCIMCKLTVMQCTRLCFTFQHIRFNYNVHCICFPYNLHSRKRKPCSVTNTGSVLFCCKRSVYQDTFLKTEDASTYQELDLPDSAY